MRYKLGDKVKIVSTHALEYCNITGCQFFFSDMQRYTGKETKIIQVNPDYYLLDLPRQFIHWSDCMLEDIKIKKQKNEVCSQCEVKIKADQFQGDFESEIYCEVCFNEQIFICNNCSQKFEKDNCYNNPEDELYCENCYSENCFVCEDCNNTHWTDDCNNFDGNYYCNDCIGEYARDCYNCNELVSVDDLIFCENCDNDYCGNCSSDHGCDSDNFQPQDQDLVFQDGKETSIITVDRFVGVELEAENGERENINLPSSFGIKTDGSLNELGVEIVTPPSKKSTLVKNIKLACEQLNKNGFEATSSAGLHVHIDLRDIKDDYIKLSRIMRTFYAIEDVMFSMLPEKRRNNSYCYPLRSQFNFYDFYGSKLAKQFDSKIYGTTDKSIIADNKKTHGLSQRYRACNFHSVFYRGTLEVRAHSSSQNPIKILRWIELLLKVVEWSTTNFKQAQVEELLKMNATKKKVHKMKNLFKFGRKVEQHINARAKFFHQEGLDIAYNLGQLPKCKVKKVRV